VGGQGCWHPAGAQVGGWGGVGDVPRLEGVGVGKVSASGRCREETEGVGGMISPDCCWSGSPSGWCWWLIYPGRRRCSGMKWLAEEEEDSRQVPG
jgi:hypothetical protein